MHGGISVYVSYSYMSVVAFLYLYYYVVVRIGRVVGLPAHSGVIGYYLVGLYY